VVVDQVLVDGHVLLLSQYGVVGFEAVLLEHSLIAAGMSMTGLLDRVVWHVLGSCTLDLQQRGLAGRFRKTEVKHTYPECRGEGSPSRGAGILGRTWLWCVCTMINGCFVDVWRGYGWRK